MKFRVVIILGKVKPLNSVSNESTVYELFCLKWTTQEYLAIAVFRTLTNIYDGVFVKIVNGLAANYIHKNLHQRCLRGLSKRLCIWSL